MESSAENSLLIVGQSRKMPPKYWLEPPENTITARLMPESIKGKVLCRTIKKN